MLSLTYGLFAKTDIAILGPYAQDRSLGLVW